MQKIWSETVPEAEIWSKTYFLTKRSEIFEAKQSEMKRNFFSRVLLWSETFLEAKLGHPKHDAVRCAVASSVRYHTARSPSLKFVVSGSAQYDFNLKINIKWLVTRLKNFSFKIEIFLLISNLFLLKSNLFLFRLKYFF